MANRTPFLALAAVVAAAVVGCSSSSVNPSNGGGGSGGATGGTSGSGGATGGAGATGGGAGATGGSGGATGGASGSPGGGAGGGSGVGGAQADAGDAGPTCNEASQCYSTGQFCKSKECVSPDMSCAGATKAQPKQADAPLLFDARQVGIGDGSLCKDDVNCTGGAKVCEVYVDFYDPQSDFAASAAPAYSKVKLVDDAGTQGPVFDAPSLIAPKMTIAFRGCFLPGSVTRAVQVIDEAGHVANAVCFSVTSP